MQSAACEGPTLFTGSGAPWTGVEVKETWTPRLSFWVFGFSRLNFGFAPFRFGLIFLKLAPLYWVKRLLTVVRMPAPAPVWQDFWV